MVGKRYITEELFASPSFVDTLKTKPCVAAIEVDKQIVWHNYANRFNEPARTSKKYTLTQMLKGAVYREHNITVYKIDTDDRYNEARPLCICEKCSVPAWMSVTWLMFLRVGHKKYKQCLKDAGKPSRCLIIKSILAHRQPRKNLIVVYDIGLTYAACIVFVVFAFLFVRTPMRFLDAYFS